MKSPELNIICFLLLQCVAISHLSVIICPSPEEVAPCSCHDEAEDDSNVVLFCSDPDTTILQIKNALRVLRNHHNLKVELDGLTLGTLPSDFFRQVQIKVLDINQCVLDNFFEIGTHPYDGQEIPLVELIIISSLTENAKVQFKYLKNLRHLDLSYNNMLELGDDWFENAPISLRHISISNNAIETIGKRAFADVTNLEFLSLDGNRFGQISRSMFPNPAKELDILELDNNDFTNLPEDIFSNMPYLKKVSLTSNRLMQLPESTWKTVWNQLDDIDLRGNPLICDSHLAWIAETPTCANVQASCLSSKINREQLNILRDVHCV